MIKCSILLLFTSCIFLLANTLDAQSYYPAYNFTTFAGNPGLGNVDASGSAASFNHPAAVASDSSGNVFVADTVDNTIRKITPAGVVTTFAGSPGIIGSADGTGSSASFNHPTGIAVDSNGTVFVADLGNSTVRKITSAGVVSTLAGTAGNSGYKDATGSAALFGTPIGVAVDSSGNVYVSEYYGQMVRLVTPAGVVTTLAGSSGNVGSNDGQGSSASFNCPESLTVDLSGNIYVADSGNHKIRKITPAGVVTTYAGNGTYGSLDGTASSAEFSSITGVTIDSLGNLYVTDTANNIIRKITQSGIVSTLAGSSNIGSKNAVGSSASFWNPIGITVDPSGNIYVADTYNNLIRKIVILTQSVTTLAGQINVGSLNGTSLDAQFFNPCAVAVDNLGNVYVADTNNNLIRKITSTGVVTTLAGSTGVAGQNNATGTAATFNHPQGVTVDSAGNVYVADSWNNAIRKISIAGSVTTLAGGSWGTSDGTAASAQFGTPKGIVSDSLGNLYVTDSNNNTIRKVSASGVVTTLAGKAGFSGYADGNGVNALFNSPCGIVLDSSGNLFVADEWNNVIRKITTQGTVSTYAGIKGKSGFNDGTTTTAKFNVPYGLAVDSYGVLYVSDQINNNIRRIDISGNVSTIGGTGNDFSSSGSSNGAGPAALFNFPQGIAVDSTGNIYVADSLNSEIRKGVNLGSGANLVYYVSPSGSDTNNGTSLTTPFQTLSKAISVIGAGSTLYIRGGTYRETIKFVFSGTASQPITIQQYNNETVTITGADIVTGWTPYSGNIYQAPMSWDLGMGNNQIFLDGVMLNQARYPHMTKSNSLLNPSTNAVIVGGQTTSSAPTSYYGLVNLINTPIQVTSTGFNQPDNTWLGAYMVGEIGEAWCDETAQITHSSSSGEFTILPLTSGFWFNGPGSVYIFGSLSALGVPGEWHNQNSTLYLWSPNSDNPNSHLVEVKHRLINMDFNYQSYVNVSGINFYSGAILMSGNNCTLNNCNANYLSHYILFPRNNNGGCDLGSSGYQGIYLSGNSNLIKNCNIAFSAGCGIEIKGSNNLIIRNTINDISYAGSNSSPIHIDYDSTGSCIWFNTIYNSGRDSIQINSPSHDIRYNDLSYPSLLTRDDGCIYTFGVESNGTRIAYNWVHDIYENGGAGTSPPHGIYLDNYSAGYVVDHNVCWNFYYNGVISPMGIFVNKPTNDNKLYNNTIFNCDSLSAYDIRGSSMYPDNNPDPKYWISDFNNYSEINDLYLQQFPTSQLISWKSLNFNLVSGAAAINTGQLIPGFTDGYVGSAPDLGAYEYGGIHWTAGVNGIGADVPTVSNSTGATSVAVNSATLNGTLTNSDYENTVVTIYWGTKDGGTSYSAWDSSAKLNFNSDQTFSANITGLNANTKYYYTLYVSNASGLSWATSSSVFQTSNLSINSQPVSVSSSSNNSFSLSVNAIGATSYQWYLNGTAIKGATSSTYTVASAQSSNAGVYYVVAISGSATVQSNNAPVSVTSNSGGAPIIINQPAAINIASGGTSVFRVGVSPTSTYQWYFNGAAVTGATSPELVIPNTSTANVGSYNCVASNTLGSVTTATAQLTLLSTTNPGRLVNLSVLTMDGPGSQMLTLGFVNGGAGTTGSEPLLIRASGPALTAFNVANVLADPTLKILQGSNAVVSNDNWGSSSANITAVNAAEAATGAFQLTPTTSLDAALVQSLTSVSGGYTVQVLGNGTGVGNALAEVYDNTANYTISSPRLINLSCLQQVPANGMLSAGFAINGATAKTVLIRVSGPTLGSFGVPGTMTDPQLNVFSGSTVIASNAGWAGDASITAANSATGAFQFTSATSKDSAVVMTLAPGSYTVQATSVSGTAGATMIEVYEVQ